MLELNEIPFSSDRRAASSSLCSSRRFANLCMNYERAEPGQLSFHVVLDAAQAALTVISIPADEPTDTWVMPLPFRVAVDHRGKLSTTI